MKKSLPFKPASFALILLGLAVPMAFAQDFTYNGSGVWQAATNWTPSGIPGVGTNTNANVIINRTSGGGIAIDYQTNAVLNNWSSDASSGGITIAGNNSTGTLAINGTLTKTGGQALTFRANGATTALAVNLNNLDFTAASAGVVSFGGNGAGQTLSSLFITNATLGTSSANQLVFLDADGASNYTVGTLTMSGGNVVLANGLSAGSQRFVNVGSLNGSTGVVRGANGNYIAATATLNLIGTSDGTYSGTILDGATVTALSKSGSATQTLSGNNAYSGNTTVSGGTLRLGNANALGFGATRFTNAATDTTTVTSGGTVDLNGQTVNEVLVLNGTGAGGVGALVNNSATAASIGSGISSIAVAASGSPGARPTITISGTGTGATATASMGLTTASITSLGSQSGTFTVGETLNASGGGGTGATYIVDATNISGIVTAVSVLQAGQGYTNAITSLTGASKTLNVTANTNNFILRGVTMTAAGSGYNGTPTYTFSTGDATPGAITPSSVTLASDSSIGGSGNMTINPVISGNFALTKVGAATVTFAGTAANTYNGNIIINDGVLEFRSTSSQTFTIGGVGTNNAVSGPGSAFFRGAFNFDLASASTNDGDSWTIVAPATTKAYDGGFSVTGFTNNSGVWTRGTNGVIYRFAQSNSILSVGTNAPVAGYPAWVGYWQTVFTNFTATATGDDPDGDGFKNGTEFAFDGVPMVGSPALLSAVKNGTNALLSWVQRNSGVTYTVKSTTNLATGGWTNAAVTVTNAADQSGINLTNDYTRRSFTVPGTDNLFFRVEAVVP